MRIIVLQGMPNTGKTETINLVWNMILNNGGSSIQRRPYGGDPKDFIDTVLYNNKRIGILSMGDLSTPIAKEIWNFNNHKCDLVICALSLSGSKIRANQAINTYNAIRIDKTVENNKSLRTQVNKDDALTLFNLI